MFTLAIARYCCPQRSVAGSPHLARTNCQRAAITLFALAELGLYAFLIQHSIATDFWEEHTWTAIGISSAIGVVGLDFFIRWCASSTTDALEGTPSNALTQKTLQPPQLSERQKERLLLPKTLVGTAGNTQLFKDSGDHYYYVLWQYGGLVYETSDKALPQAGKSMRPRNCLGRPNETFVAAGRVGLRATAAPSTIVD